MAESSWLYAALFGWADAKGSGHGPRSNNTAKTKANGSPRLGTVGRWLPDRRLPSGMAGGFHPGSRGIQIADRAGFEPEQGVYANTFAFDASDHGGPPSVDAFLVPSPFLSVRFENTLTFFSEW
jgi:hypothetical protein